MSNLAWSTPSKDQPHYSVVIANQTNFLTITLRQANLYNNFSVIFFKLWGNYTLLLSNAVISKVRVIIRKGVSRGIPENNSKIISNCELLGLLRRDNRWKQEVTTKCLEEYKAYSCEQKGYSKMWVIHQGININQKHNFIYLNSVVTV